MFSFLKASPPAPRIESSRTDAEYKKIFFLNLNFKFHSRQIAFYGII